MSAKPLPNTTWTYERCEVSAGRYRVMAMDLSGNRTFAIGSTDEDEGNVQRIVQAIAREVERVTEFYARSPEDRIHGDVRVNPATGDVEVVAPDGSLRRAGTSLGVRARAALPVHGTDDCIALLKYDERPERGAFQNLLRLTRDGGVVWRAELPTTANDDAYVGVEWAGAQLVAFSWSCYRVALDARNGRIVRAEFTK